MVFKIRNDTQVTIGDWVGIVVGSNKDGVIITAPPEVKGGFYVVPPERFAKAAGRWIVK